MPCLLAIEAGTSEVSLAVMEGEELLFEESFVSARQHHVLLFEPLKRAIEVLEKRTLQGVVIGTGPGSYSGIRVAIAAGQGVALVHNCPVAGLPSVLATSIKSGFAVGDARRGGAWWAQVEPGTPEVITHVVSPEELAERVKGEENVFSIQDISQLKINNPASITQQVPTAKYLLRTWRGLSDEQKEKLLEIPPQALYVRPPHITKAKRGHPLLQKIIQGGAEFPPPEAK